MTTPAYRDAALPVDPRVEDLLSRMTPEGKACQLCSLLRYTTPEPAGERLLTHFGLLAHEAREMARWQNAVQEAAAQTRLGIPVTVSTEPRHAFTHIGIRLPLRRVPTGRPAARHRPPCPGRPAPGPRGT
ncbi:hypothetical protein [Streptomyces sp. NPDC086023]|uniref:hypothetical protein n=1 Tax=Streptomyces sp. NPDC086023 TaxID=3365746 RepID=UPI0037D3BA96